MYKWLSARLQAFLSRKRSLALPAQQLFFMTLGRFLKVGSSPLKALQFLNQHASQRVLRGFGGVLYPYLMRGQTLSFALASVSYQVDPVAQALLRAGEARGSLEEACHHILAYLKSRIMFHRQLRGALRYPLLVLGAFILCFLSLQTFFLPQVAVFLEDQVACSSATASLLWVAAHEGALYAGFGILALFVCLISLGIRLSQRMRTSWDYFMLRIPLLSTYLYATRWVCFFSLFHRAMCASLTLPKAFDIASTVLDYAPLRTWHTAAQKDLMQGRSVGHIMQGAPKLSEEARYILCMAAEAGDITPLLDHVSTVYQDTLDELRAKIQSYVGPVCLVCVGALFLWVIQGAVLPFYDHAFSLDRVGGA